VTHESFISPAPDVAGDRASVVAIAARTTSPRLIWRLLPSSSGHGVSALHSAWPVPPARRAPKRRNIRSLTADHP